MKKLQEDAVVTVAQFNNQGTLDKNGKLPVMLRVISGTGVNRNVIAGTVAENEGFEVGKTYFVSLTEKEASPEYGRQFNWNKIKELSFTEILEAKKALGSPKMINIDAEAKDSDIKTIFESAKETISKTI